MSDVLGEPFKYGSKNYQIILGPSSLTTVYRVKKKGLEPVHGVMAFRVVSAYKKKVLGEKVVRQPRLFAKKARKRH
jgi:hypothetical protein